MNRLLKLDPTNTTLLAQKQKLLKDAIAETKAKFDTLKEAQRQAKQQFESGTLGKEKYDALQRQITQTENDLKKLQQEAHKSSDALVKLSNTGDKLIMIGKISTGIGSVMKIGSSLIGVFIKVAGAFTGTA